MQRMVIIHNLRSVYNVASIFRTADAAGVNKIFLTGYSPAPKDRFGFWRKDFAKVALGAEKSVEWEEAEIFKVIEKLKKEGYEVVALEQEKKSIDYKKYNPVKDFALIVGNEPDGIEKDVLNVVDKIIEIPMKGEKESLNVSIAFGIAIYRLLDL